MFVFRAFNGDLFLDTNIENNYDDFGSGGSIWVCVLGCACVMLFALSTYWRDTRTRENSLSVERDQNFSSIRSNKAFHTKGLPYWECMNECSYGSFKNKYNTSNKSSTTHTLQMTRSMWFRLHAIAIRTRYMETKHSTLFRIIEAYPEHTQTLVCLRFKYSRHNYWHCARNSCCNECYRKSHRESVAGQVDKDIYILHEPFKNTHTLSRKANGFSYHSGRKALVELYLCTHTCAVFATEYCRVVAIYELGRRRMGFCGHFRYAGCCPQRSHVTHNWRHDSLVIKCARHIRISVRNYDTVLRYKRSTFRTSNVHIMQSPVTWHSFCCTRAIPTISQHIVSIL